MDDLLLQHQGDEALSADLELMRGQIAKCKSSLTELTPAGGISVRLAPELQEVRVRPDSSLDSAIHSLLRPDQADTQPVLTVEASRQGRMVSLYIGQDEPPAQQTAIEAPGGELSVMPRPSGGTTIAITTPAALLHFS